MSFTIEKDAVNQTIDAWIESSASPGTGLTGLVFNTASLTCYYRRGATGTMTALALVTQTVGGAHSDGGFVEIDSTNAPGLYRLDLSDAIVATGVEYVTLFLRGAANMYSCKVRVELVNEINVTSGVVQSNIKQVADVTANGTNLAAACAAYSATRGLSGTSLPAAVADAAGGLAISDAGGLAMDTLADWINGGRLDLLIDAIKVVTDKQATPSDTMAVLTATGGSATTFISGTLPGSLSLTTNQWAGTDPRSILFDIDTVTAGLRGTRVVIDSHTSGTTPTFVFSALHASQVVAATDTGTLI